MCYTPAFRKGRVLRIAAVMAHFENAEVLFHDTSSYEAELESCAGNRIFERDLFKLCAPTLFPEYDRILCSDVDVVFTGDVSSAYFAHPR